MSKKKETRSPGSESDIFHTEADDMPFGRQNYILMLVGLAIIVLGFILMIGDQDVYGFTKVKLAPIVIMAGFIFEIYAIMKKPVRAE